MFCCERNTTKRLNLLLEDGNMAFLLKSCSFETMAFVAFPIHEAVVECIHVSRVFGGIFDTFWQTQMSAKGKKSHRKRRNKTKKNDCKKVSNPGFHRIIQKNAGSCPSFLAVSLQGYPLPATSQDLPWTSPAPSTFIIKGSNCIGHGGFRFCRTSVM